MNFIIYSQEQDNYHFRYEQSITIHEYLTLSQIPSHWWVLFTQLEWQWGINSLNIKDDFTWLVNVDKYPPLTAQEIGEEQISWFSQAKFIQTKFAHKYHLLPNPYQVLQELINQNILTPIQNIYSHPTSIKYQINQNLPQKVLAIVPHFNCHQWLNYCLSSLINQSRELTNIVVVDDCSLTTPQDICQIYPQVTLVQTPLSVGPYQIIQSVISQTNYDAYLFQDADDFSTTNRLETLLKLMNLTGADLVGTQEYRLDEINHTVAPVIYPLDVNQALQEKPGHALLHPTSLIRKSAVVKLNGFANGLLFGGDTEFLLRAHYHLKIVNSPKFCYVRRKRVDSLTTSTLTGLNSPLRQDLLFRLKRIASQNYDRVARGKEPLTQPLSSLNTIPLAYITGPKLFD